MEARRDSRWGRRSHGIGFGDTGRCKSEGDSRRDKKILASHYGYLDGDVLVKLRLSQ